MTEVHRYKVVKMLSEGGNRISYDPHGPEVVMAEALDAALAREAALQQRLNEADQRVDEAEQLLRDLVTWSRATDGDLVALVNVVSRADAICQLTKDSPEVETPEQEGVRLARKDPRIGLSNLWGDTLRKGEEFNRFADAYETEARRINRGDSPEVGS